MSRAPWSPLGPRSYPAVPQTLQGPPRHQVCFDFTSLPPTPPAAAPLARALTPRPTWWGCRGAHGPGTRGGGSSSSSSSSRRRRRTTRRRRRRRRRTGREAPPSQPAARTGSSGDPRQSTKTGGEAATQATAAARGWAQSALRGQGRGRQDWKRGSEKWGAEGGAASGQVRRKAPQASRDAAARWQSPGLTPPAPLPARQALAAAGARASPRSPARCRRPRCAPLCAPRSRRAPGVSKGGQLMGRARIGCSAVSSPPARPPSRTPPPAPAPAFGVARCWAPSVARPTKAQRGGPRVVGPRCAAAVAAAGSSRQPLFV
uniref:translation initiation factor IF-2-like n=1 Tax=Callithrix jacchus TaxID=9483 RepID=UPI00159E6B55|nr:translation initiation factor IF-2-like [Callithrix jacchus]